MLISSSRLNVCLKRNVTKFVITVVANACVASVVELWREDCCVEIEVQVISMAHFFRD